MAASGKLRSLARSAPVLPMIRFTSWGLPRCPAGLLSGVGCNRMQVSHAVCSQACQMGPIRGSSSRVIQTRKTRTRGLASGCVEASCCSSQRRASSGAQLVPAPSRIPSFQSRSRHRVSRRWRRAAAGAWLAWACRCTCSGGVASRGTRACFNAVAFVGGLRSGVPLDRLYNIRLHLTAPREQFHMQPALNGCRVWATSRIGVEASVSRGSGPFTVRRL